MPTELASLEEARPQRRTPGDGGGSRPTSSSCLSGVAGSREREQLQKQAGRHLPQSGGPHRRTLRPSGHHVLERERMYDVHMARARLDDGLPGRHGPGAHGEVLQRPARHALGQRARHRPDRSSRVAPTPARGGGQARGGHPTPPRRQARARWEAATHYRHRRRLCDHHDQVRNRLERRVATPIQGVHGGFRLARRLNLPIHPGVWRHARLQHHVAVEPRGQLQMRGVRWEGRTAESSASRHPDRQRDSTGSGLRLGEALRACLVLAPDGALPGLHTSHGLCGGTCCRTDRPNRRGHFSDTGPGPGGRPRRLQVNKLVAHAVGVTAPACASTSAWLETGHGFRRDPKMLGTLPRRRRHKATTQPRYPYCAASFISRAACCGVVPYRASHGHVELRT